MVRSLLLYLVGFLLRRIIRRIIIWLTRLALTPAAVWHCGVNPFAVIKVVLRCGAAERGAVVTIGSVSTNE